MVNFLLLENINISILCVYVSQEENTFSIDCISFNIAGNTNTLSEK